MAAKLKKRALAEFQSQVVVEDKGEKTKRLKLVTKKGSSADQETDTLLTLDTAECSNRDVVRHLVTFTAGLESQSEEALGVALRKVTELLARVEEPCTLARLVTAWGELVVRSPDLVEDLQPRIDQLLSGSKVGLAKESKVGLARETAAWLAAFRNIASKLSLKRSTKQQLFKVGETLLHSSPHPQVHCKALGLLSLLVDSEDCAESREMATNGLRLCGAYSMSQDARVRTAAFHGLLTIHKRGVRLDVSMYPVFCTALTDDYEGVRCEALKLISALAETEPELPVEVAGAQEGDETNRLVDDVFSRTCQAMSDVREQVRCLAAKIIGGIVGVSKLFLEQTLDKKLMSNMRLKKSAHERMANLISSGDWSSGKKWADDAPKERLDEDQVNLVAFGSCGAFVHGLEDECLSVRVASVESLTKLSIGNQDLALIALDFLVDMFNDEIEQVRLKAIESLTAISRHILLQVHQLETILGALDDFSTLLREKLHLMLQACTIATKDGLKNVIQKLLTNLKRYPQDRRSILQTFKHLGSNHPDLTLPLVTSLLEIHPYFDKQEQDIEDPAYLCTLILVLNAAQHCPTLPMLLDSHTRRHHSYLQDTFPHLIPSQGGLVTTKTPGLPSKTAEFLSSVLGRVQVAARMSPARRLAVLHTSVSELSRLSSIEPSLGDPSSFARCYMEGQALYLRVVGDPSWSQFSSLASTSSGQVVRSNIHTLQGVALKLHSMFSKIGEDNLFKIKMFKLKVQAVSLVYTVCGSNKSALSQTEAFMTEFDRVTKEMSEADIAKEPFLVGVLQSLTIPEAKPGYIARKLKPLLVSDPLAGLQTVPLETAMVKATIHSPTGDQETPLKCMAGLVLGIPMDCEVDNIMDTEALRICIFTGDQQHHLSIPRRGDLTPSETSPTSYRLLTTALLSHQVWSEPLDVEVSLVLDLNMGTDSKKVDNKGAHDNIVHICKPVKVSVLPKPVRRGL